jgi:FtsP/CotA-like multicopper oxidase with cupredoxin domain
MDGAADVTQKPIEPGETFTYEFTAGQAGTYFYHSHKEPDRQQGLGMYGALIVDPKDPGRDAAYDYDKRWWSSSKSGWRGTATPTRP